MGYAVSLEKFQTVFDSWRKKIRYLRTEVFEGTGRFSETDVVRYGKVTDLADIDWNERSEYSFKDILLPLSQTLLYFTEHGMTESEGPTRGTIVFLRSCDLHAVKRLDYMFLENGPEDSYYKRVRDGLKFVLMGCDHDFDGCFCVSMGTNISTDYDAAVNVHGDDIEIDCKDEDLARSLRAIGCCRSRCYARRCVRKQPRSQGSGKLDVGCRQELHLGRIRQALHQVRSLHRRLSDLHLLVHAGSLLHRKRPGRRTAPRPGFMHDRWLYGSSRRPLFPQECRRTDAL